jgi:hypothetical protein
MDHGVLTTGVSDAYAWQMGQQAVPYQRVRELVKSLQPGIVVIDRGGLCVPWLGDVIYFEQPLGVTSPAGNTYASLRGDTITGAGWFWHPQDPDTDPLSAASILARLADREFEAFDAAPAVSGLLGCLSLIGGCRPPLPCESSPFRLASPHRTRSVKPLPTRPLNCCKSVDKARSAIGRAPSALEISQGFWPPGTSAWSAPTGWLAARLPLTSLMAACSVGGARGGSPDPLRHHVTAGERR